MLYQTDNPATGEVVQSFSSISDTELEAAVRKADACYRDDWRHRSIADRAQVVSAAAAILRQKANECARYVTLEMGELLSGAVAEVRLSADILDYYAKNAHAFMEPKHFPGFPEAAFVTRPIGQK